VFVGIDAQVRSSAYFTIMAAAFGFVSEHHTDLIPTSRLVEHCPMVYVFQLARQHRIEGNQIQLATHGDNFGGLEPAPESEAKPQTINLGWHEQCGIVAKRNAFVCPDNCGRRETNLRTQRLKHLATSRADGQCTC